MRPKELFHRIVAPIDLWIWRTFEPRAEGAKALIECNGSFLMIRNTYGARHWTFPGGRKRKRETPEEAATREVKEEVGITITDWTPLGSYFHTRQHKKDTIYSVYAKVSSFDHKIDRGEVGDSGWFTLDEIRELDSVSESVEDVLTLYRKHQEA
jgi:8-oxo-dGTP diphosphatase